jgi:organic hydroperoxide reductase OsmC/OhrA
MEKLYTGSVTAKGGRDGHVKSSDGIIDFEIRKPRELGGQGVLLILNSCLLLPGDHAILEH